MKKVLRWILLLWAIITVPYLFEGSADTVFFSLLFVGLIIGLMVSDLRGDKK